MRREELIIVQGCAPTGKRGGSESHREETGSCPTGKRQGSVPHREGRDRICTQWEEMGSAPWGRDGDSADGLSTSVQRKDFILKNKFIIISFSRSHRPSNCLPQSSTKGSSHSQWDFKNSNTATVCQQGPNSSPYPKLS